MCISSPIRDTDSWCLGQRTLPLWATESAVDGAGTCLLAHETLEHKDGHVQ
jgi:hypothetical protein